MLTASSALALTACGGDDQQVERRTETRPTIARATAMRLADRSDTIATLLDNGDACGAARAAADLRRDAIETINRREVPERYLEDFLAAVHELEAQIPPCDEPTDEPVRGKGKRKDKKKNKNKGESHGHEGDD